MGEWRNLKLSDLCSSVDYGYTASANSNSQNPKFLRITDIVPGYINWDSVPHCDIDSKNYERNKLSHDDIVIARTGATTGYSCYINTPPAAVFASYLVRLKINNLNHARFVAYYLKSSQFFNYLNGVLGDKSAQPNASASTLVNAPINVPSYTKQEKIASILSSLDDKIELNRKMNETLEEMARAIFKSWFVDFDPVHAKARGEKPAGMPDEIADLFPSEFVHSDLLGKPIPKGWEVKSLGDCIKIYDSKRIPLSKREREKRQGSYPYYGAASLMDYVDDYIFDGIYLLLGEDGTVMDSSGLPSLQYVWGQFWVNNHAHVIKGKGTIATEHIYLFLAHTNIAAYVTGAVQLKLNQKNLNSIPFCFSSDELNNAFSIIIKPLFESYMQNHEELITLQVLRDSLLPKLISGEIEV